MSAETTEPRPLGRGGLSHRRPTGFDRFWFGVCYYPEHWEAATRARDGERMAAAGVNVVRMAEFAWDLIEPQSGRFDFSLFDQTIAALAAHGISTILCTPTAAPPRWLTRSHPEILRVDASGMRMEHGSRQHVCTTNAYFREHSRRITALMAEHVAGNPHVVGWQTDNEFHCHFAQCHCAACQAGFRGYLQRRYRDIAELNRRWGTRFWAQTYSGFDEIPTPRRSRPTHPNPAHELDYLCFLSDATARFQHEQVEILRRVQPRWFITHNGVFSHLDYRGLFGQDLDVLGYDVYPMFNPDPRTRPRGQAFALDRCRALTGNFVVPEQQSGAGGQPPYYLDNPEPGEMRQMTYRSLAHGADALLYFRWRTCRFGAEEYWNGIIDHDDVPRRRHQEQARIGRELRAVGPALLGTTVHIDAAVAHGEQRVSDAHHVYSLGLPSDDEVAREVHAALRQRGIAVGCVHPTDDLAGVKLYVLPHWAWFDPAWTANLLRFVDGGGTLVVGARTATRDVDNNVVAQTLPGCLRDLVGATVEEYGKQNAAEQRPRLFALSDVAVAAALPRSEHWYELLAPDAGTRTVATWRGRDEGAVAATERVVGRGRVIYVGTYLTGAVLEALTPVLIERSGLKPAWPCPAGVQIVLRAGQGRRLWFVFNEHDEPVAIERAPCGTDLCTGRPCDGALELERFGVAVIRE